MQRRKADPPTTKIGVDMEDINNNGNSILLRNEQQLQNKKNRVQRSIVQFIRGPFHDFFHARTGPKGCRVAGYIRVCYSILFLYTTILMAIQAHLLFDPRTGLLPYIITRDELQEFQWSFFQLAPESSVVLYGLFVLGVACGVLLLLGLYPRAAAVGIFFFLHNMCSQNDRIWNGEAYMNRMWAFFLMFMPLDHITLHDGFGGWYSHAVHTVHTVRQHFHCHNRTGNNIPDNNHPFSLPAVCLIRHPSRNQLSKSQSWPMWPFRLWQVYICMVYIGAGIGKLVSPVWRRGTALSWLWYYDQQPLGRFYPIFVTEILYNRMITIKIQTWLSLLIENLCYVTIWFPFTRRGTFLAIVLLHIGIELGLRMHIFEYLSVLGFGCFFAYPNDIIRRNKKTGTSIQAAVSAAKGGIFAATPDTKILQSITAGILLYLLVFDTFPKAEVEYLMPSIYRSLVQLFVYPSTVTSNSTFALTKMLGMYTGPYTLFDGKPPHEEKRPTAVIRFRNGMEPILWQQREWSDSSMVQREIDYWFDTYLYYLLREGGKIEGVRLYAMLSLHLAQLYSKGGIRREYSKIAVEPNNIVESISIQIHTRFGDNRPPDSKLSYFASIPRTWTYASECRFVLNLNTVQLQDKTHYFDMQQIWDYNYNVDLMTQNGCAYYNQADEAYHSKGRYGVPIMKEEDSFTVFPTTDVSKGSDSLTIAPSSKVSRA